MNVDILFEYGSLNGGEHSMLTLLPRMQRRGIGLRIIAPPIGPLVDAIQALELELVPFPIEPGMPISRRRELLEEILRNLSPKLLHANSVSMARLSGPVVATSGIASVAHFRDIIRLNRTAIADIDRHGRFLAVSGATRDFHVGQGVDPARFYVLYNGVDPERFRPAPPTGFLHREWGIPENAPILAVIGQIGLRKGQDQLIESLAPIFESRRDVHLLVVGRRWSEKEESIRFEARLRESFRQRPFRGRVHFSGVRNDIPALMNELTLLIHPARQEPLGRVLLEAAASGVPVVANDVGGTEEIFPDSRFESPDDLFRESSSAAIVPHWDTRHDNDLLRAAIEALLDSPPARERLAEAARRRIVSVFSPETAAEALCRHYEAVLEPS